MIPTRFLAAAALVTFARAQLTTLSTIPVINGETVVVSLSTDAVGATVPVVIGTLSSAAATSPVATPGVTTTPVATTSTPVAASTSAPATSTAVAVTNTVTTTTPRVVGQPGSTNPAPGPTTYTYTTRDANGQTTIVVDVFTASYGYATSTASPKPPGTILPYDVYTSLYGGGAGNNNQLNAARELAVSGAGALMCVIGGMAMLL